MKVESIVDRVTTLYASTRFYSDRGSITMPAIGGSYIFEGDFETSFERPDRFLFAFSGRVSGPDPSKTWKPAYRIRCDGAHLRIGYPEWKEGHPESVASCIASLTGVTYGTAHSIPRLLLPDRVTGRGLFDGECVLAEAEAIGGVAHLVIEVGQRRRMTRVYVREGSWCIRRLVSFLGVEVYPGPKAASELVTTDYHPVLTASASN